MNMGKCVPTLFDAFSQTWKQNHKDWEKSIFTDLYPRKVDWKNRLTGTELDQYLPESRESVHIKFSDINTDDPTKSSPNLKLFESIDGDCFNVGGPVWSAAWCPTPPNGRHTQYVSLACHRTLEEGHSSYEEYSGKGLLQIWDLGELTIDSEKVVPQFVLGIAHESGCVYDMSWCPAGCVRKPEKNTNSQGEEVMSRLGLLALACSDSTVKIYSVPHPSELTTDDQDEKLIFKASPTFILHSKFPGPGESRGCCMSVDWDPNKERSLILAGYGKGYICIFDLNTQSPLLTVQNLTGLTDLFPIKSILGHSLKVTGCQWCPWRPGYFATGSSDRLFCIWDIKDIKRCVVREMCDQISTVRWIPAWHQPIGAQLENMLLFNSHINLLHPLDKTGVYKKVLVNTSLFGAWDMDVSPWLHVVIFCNNIGHVTGLKLDHSYDHHRKKKTYKKMLFFLYEALTEMNDDKTISNNTDNNNSGLSEEVAMETDQIEDISTQATQKSSSVEEADVPPKEDDKPKQSLQEMDRFSYEEIKESCCLHFKTNHTLQNAYNVWGDERFFSKSETVLPKERFSKYPLTAIYSVSCSPNASSCSWVLSGGQSGIVRLSNLSGLITDDARASLHKAQLVESPSHKDY